MDFQSWDSGFEQLNDAPAPAKKKDSRILIAALLLVALTVVILISIGHPKPALSAWDGCLCIEQNENGFTLQAKDAEQLKQFSALLLRGENKEAQWINPASVQAGPEGKLLQFNAQQMSAGDLIIPLAYRSDENLLLVGEPQKWNKDQNAVQILIATPQPKLTEGPSIRLEATAVDGTGGCVVQLEMHLNGLEPGYTYNTGFLLAKQGQNPQSAGERGYAWGVTEADFTVLVSLPLQDVPREHLVMAYVYVQTTEEMIFSEPYLFVPDKLNPAVTPPKPTRTPTPTPKSTPTPAPHYQFNITVTPTNAVKTPTPTATPTPQPLTPSAKLFSICDQSTRYYYLQLNAREKQCFSEMYDGICAREAKITLTTPCSKPEFLRVLDVLSYDCPELLECFEVDTYHSMGDQVVFCNVIYNLTVTEHNRIISHIQDVVSWTEAGRKGEYEKEIALFAYIQKNTVYDKTTANCANAIGTFMEGRAKCAGYAQGAMLGLRCMGINSASVTGFTFEDDGSLADIGHEWLYVQIEGKWYQCDPTWDDPDGGYIFGDGALLYMPYTNVTDAMMADERIINNFVWRCTGFSQPKCNSLAANYYQREGCFVASGADPMAFLKRAVVKASDSGLEWCLLFFESPADYDAFVAADEFKDLKVNNSDGDRLYLKHWWRYDSDMLYIDQIGEY